MPARTRLVKQVAAIFIVFVLGILLIQPFISTEIETYDLSNEIATNADNTGRQLAEVDLKSVAGKTISTKSLSVRRRLSTFGIRPASRVDENYRCSHRAPENTSGVSTSSG